MKLLALPDDEREIVQYLCFDEGLKLLVDRLDEEGRPSIARDPVAMVPPELPSARRLMAAVTPGVGVTDPNYRDVWKFTFWAEHLGPIRTLGDAPPPQDAVDRVGLQLNRERTNRWRDLIDPTRTPLIGLRRTSWHVSEDCLIAGALTTMAVRTRELPPDVRRLYSSIERHLKRHGERLDPFETCAVYPGPRRDPNRSRGWWMWALPHALAWIEAGGQAFAMDFISLGPGDPEDQPDSA